jgi:hypothetical protein
VLSLDTSNDDIDEGEGIWIVDGNEFPIYLLNEPDWAQFDATQYGSINRHVLYGILRSSSIISVSFTYTDPSLLRIDFEDGSVEIFNITLRELDRCVNEFVEFPLPYGRTMEFRISSVDWKKEGF